MVVLGRMLSLVMLMLVKSLFRVAKSGEGERRGGEGGRGELGWYHVGHQHAMISLTTNAAHRMSLQLGPGVCWGWRASLAISYGQW